MKWVQPMSFQSSVREHSGEAVSLGSAEWPISQGGRETPRKVTRSTIGRKERAFQEKGL